MKEQNRTSPTEKTENLEESINAMKQKKKLTYFLKNTNFQRNRKKSKLIFISNSKQFIGLFVNLHYRCTVSSWYRHS